MNPFRTTASESWAPWQYEDTILRLLLDRARDTGLTLREVARGYCLPPRQPIPPVLEAARAEATAALEE